MENETNLVMAAEDVPQVQSGRGDFFKNCPKNTLNFSITKITKIEILVGLSLY
ncbi:MAG: hypothetical protein WCX66_04760 [archaeon]